MGPSGAQRQLAEPARKKLANAMTVGGGGAGQIPAGFTYLGQFVDDLTFDKTQVVLGQNLSPARLLQARSPSLDLDSLYGGGPADPGSVKFYSDGLRLKRRSRPTRRRTASTCRASARGRPLRGARR